MPKSYTIFTILFYLCILIFGNVIFLIVFDWNPTETGLTNVVFFNISFLSLFLPMLTCRHDDERNQIGGQRLLSYIYFIINTLITVYLIYNNICLKSTLIVQILLLGLFILCYFGIMRANVRSNHAFGKCK